MATQKPEHLTHLATEVLSEHRTLTYRNVSRALKVHVNAAKCMLYEFHAKENKKKSGSVYATYLVAGVKKALSVAAPDHKANGDGEEGGDTSMRSSPPPFPSSFAAASQGTEVLEERVTVPVKTVTLCREEDLAKVKEQFERITACHLYSVSGVRVMDLVTLTDASRDVFVGWHVKQDPLVHNKDYGIVSNERVWRRSTTKRPAGVEKMIGEPVLEKKKEVVAKPFGTKKEEIKKSEADGSRPSSRDSTTTLDSSKGKPNLKRDGSSLFKAFAKQSAKPKLERKDTDTSRTSDAKMSGLDSNDDEGESEDEAMFLDTGTKKGSSKKRASDLQKEKEERQAKLRKMMEDDEDAESALPKVEDAAKLDDDTVVSKQGEDPDAADGDKVDWSDSDTEKKKTLAVADLGPKRRRGKRKVMKKKTTTDEDGFLVTKEEEAWESFSEDEPEKKPPVQVKKPALPANTAAPSKAGSAKGAPKAGAAPAGKKKDIMSFFGKK